ncbi:MAG: hypothetical protein I4N50_13975 [Rhizobium sp.]|nr:hypothetical protein [Rhizobium sp.]
MPLRLRAMRGQQRQAKRQQAGNERTAENLDHGSVLDDADNREQGRLRRHGVSKHPVRNLSRPPVSDFIWAAGLPGSRHFGVQATGRLKRVQIAQLGSGHLDYGDTRLA